MPEGPDTLKIFDINLRQSFYTKEILCDSFSRCNILKINDEELVTVSRMFGYPGIDLKDKCWILLAKYNLKMLILTCGVNGSYVFTPGHISFVETPKVEVADTVGAGDSFTARFHCCDLEGPFGRRSTSSGCRYLGICLHTTGGYACISRNFDWSVVINDNIFLGKGGYSEQEIRLFLFEDCSGQKARCEKYVWTFHPFFLHETGGFSGENFCSTSTI